ncbi:MAG: hypothetical protein LPK80_01235 [Bacteroidota bacterium]|nr:hypothetical protein [Bacteroidota bacterium]
MKKEDHLALVLSIVGLAWMLTIVILQPNIADTADGLSHYFLARFLPQSPSNALDHWGKPIFTLLAALPAQWGVKGVMTMNAIFISTSGFLLYLTSKQLGLRFSFLAPLLLVLSNGVMNTVMGGLTEPTFVLFLSLILYSGLKKRWSTTYILTGSLILIRPEAVIVIPLVLIWGMTKGKIRQIPWVGLIPFLFTFYGVLVYDLNIHWIFSSQPYHVQSIYGNGTWEHYFIKWRIFTSPTLGFLFLLGIILWRKPWREAIPLVGIPLGILGLHIFLWRFGLMGSAGLPRTLVTALPCMVVVGINAFEPLKGKHKSILAYAVIIWVIIDFLRYNRYPKGRSVPDRTAMELSEKINSFIDESSEVWYQYSGSAQHLNLNVFDHSRVFRLWSLNKLEPGLSVRKGGILIWDNLTGHREGQLPLARIRRSRYFEPIDSAGSLEQVKIIAFRAKMIPDTLIDLALIPSDSSHYFRIKDGILSFKDDRKEVVIFHFDKTDLEELKDSLHVVIYPLGLPGKAHLNIIADGHKMEGPLPVDLKIKVPERELILSLVKFQDLRIDTLQVFQVH